MLKKCLTVAFVLITVFVYAQKYTVAGTIRDAKSNQALSGATVQVEGTNKFAITDAFGKFMIDRIPTGEYVLLIRSLGYEAKSERLTINNNTTLDVSLPETIQLTDEVVITATRAGENAPATFSTVDKTAIQKQNFGQDLPFLLNWTPSIVTTSDAGTGIGYTGMRIRGSDATNINVTINGIPYNDAESLGTFWVDIPDIATSTQSIQIQRGVGTSTNGGGAFGASINLQTNTLNDQPYATIGSAAGSFGTFKNSINFGTGMLNDHWVIDGRISKIVSDGFIDRATADLESYYFSAGYYSGKTLIKAITFGGHERTYQAWYGVPQSRLENDIEAMEQTVINEGWNEEQRQNLLTSNSRTFNPYTYKNQVDDYNQQHYQLHFSQQLKDGLTANAALHYTPGKGYYEEYRYDNDFEDYGIDPITIGGETITSSDLIRRRWLDNDFYGITYSVNYQKNNLDLIVGGAWNRYEGDHFGEIIWAEVSPVPAEYQYYFNSGDKRDFNIFTKATFSFTDRISGYLDLQYRKVDYSANGLENKQFNIDVNETFDFFNPKAGVVVSLNDQDQLYASYSLAHREPVRSDFVDAPAGKKPVHEKLHNVEMGYKYIKDRLQLKVNYFLMLYRDQLVLTGELNDVGASLRTNVDQSYRTGIEAEALIRISNKFAWTGNMTLSQNKIKDFTEVLYDYGMNWDEYNVVENKYSNVNIAYSPSLIAASGLSYFPVRNLELTLLTKYVSKQYLDNTANNARVIDDYLINDIRITYTVKPSLMKELAFSLLLNNILDETYESNGYTWGYLGGGGSYRENYYYPQAGLNFMGMVTLKF